MNKILLIFLSLSSFLFSDVKVVENTTLNGLELKYKGNTSLSQCLSLCEGSRGCKAINYRHSTKRCGLLKSYSARMEIKGISSGVYYPNYKRVKEVSNPEPKEIKVVTQKPKEIKVVTQKPKEIKVATPKPKEIKVTTPKPKENTVPYKENEFVSNVKSGFSSGVSSVGGFLISSFSSVKESIGSISFDNKEIKPSSNNIYNAPVIKETNTYGKATSKIAPIEEETISTMQEDSIVSSVKDSSESKKSSNSIVTDFSNAPIKNIFTCELFERKSDIVVVSKKKCEMRRYLFDDKTKISINFIGGTSFVFIKNNNGDFMYLNNQEREVAYFSESKNNGEFLFDIYKLTYEK